MFYTIYKITNNLNGRVYVGKHQTKDLDDDYMGSGKILMHAIKKHGIENFEKEILYIFDNEDEMNAKEAELVTEDFVKEDTNYNLCPGGQGGWWFINENRLNQYPGKSELDREKLKSARKRLAYLHKNDKEWKKRNSLSLSAGQLSRFSDGRPGTFSGRSHTKEWKQNHSVIMKEKQKGSKNSQYGTIWITNGLTNRKIKNTDSVPTGWYRGRN